MTTIHTHHAHQAHSHYQPQAIRNRLGRGDHNTRRADAVAQSHLKEARQAKQEAQVSRRNVQPVVYQTPVQQSYYAQPRVEVVVQNPAPVVTNTPAPVVVTQPQPKPVQTQAPVVKKEEPKTTPAPKTTTTAPVVAPQVAKTESKPAVEKAQKETIAKTQSTLKSAGMFGLLGALALAIGTGITLAARRWCTKSETKAEVQENAMLKWVKSPLSENQM